MKPIILSTEDVRAALDGRKTMARLPIKHQPDKSAQFKRISCGRACFGTDIDMWNIMLPYQPGDVLWVRETWQEVYETEYDIYNPNEPLKITDLIVDFENLPKKCVGLSREWSCASMPARNKYYVYAASKPKYTDEKHELKWRPSTQMPREAARLFLRVTDVRVERVQDITENDAIREGIMYTDYGMNGDMGKMSIDGGKTFHEIEPIHYPGYHAGGATNPSQCVYTARSAFAGEWDARNTKRGYGWDTNPFCWVIEFKRVEKGEES